VKHFVEGVLFPLLIGNIVAIGGLLIELSQ
jgi:hypothetical protein